MTVAWTTLVAAWFLASFSSIFAASVSSIGPIAELDELVVQVMLGDSLGLEPDQGMPMFSRDRARAAHVKEAIKAAVSERLRRGGLRVTEEAKNAVQCNLFGGTFKEAANEASVYFMLQVQVCVAGSDCTQERTILGVVNEAALEQRVVSAAVVVIDEFTKQRARYRATRNNE